MVEQTRRIVPAADSEIHDEPHIEGSRVTVRLVHERVEAAGLDPRAVAERHNLDPADVYHALAYYHEHPEEMRRVEGERERAVREHRRRAITGPDDLE